VPHSPRSAMVQLCNKLTQGVSKRVIVYIFANSHSGIGGETIY
jgi:hypothetical protein